MVDVTPPLPGLSPVAEKAIVAPFDGGRLSSDGGLLVLRQIERRLSVADRLAACIDDPRDPASTVHTHIIRFRLLMIAAGYEDANDATGLRLDPLFKMALERLPSERDLCSQSAISRLENLPDARTLLRLGRALVDLYCASFRQVPRRIVLDVDDTFYAVHGGQQLRLFNAHYDDYGFQPIVVFDQDGRFVTAVLRPAKRPKGVEIRAFLRRLVGAIRATWPRVRILLRADSAFAREELMAWCEANRVDYVFGLARNDRLVAAIAAEMADASAECRATGRPGRRFKDFLWSTLSSWSRRRRVIGKAAPVPRSSCRADTEAMQVHLDEIARAVAPGAHAVVLLDQAGWHTTPNLRVRENLTLLSLPPRSPELNPAENLWQFLRQTFLSNRVFETYDAILDAACDAWNAVLDTPWRIMSIGLGDWAHTDRC